MGYSTADLRRVACELESADAVVVGAGAGLSTAAGFTYSGERFTRLFDDFERRFGFHDMYSGGFYPYDTPEEHWAFWSRSILCNRFNEEPSPLYLELLHLIEDKDHFVITTNVDHQFQTAGFDKHRLFYTQGDYGLFQCSKPCQQKTYDNEEVVRRMVAEQRDMRIPSELVPTCPNCGAPMSMNLRSDETFVQDEGWYTAAARYQEFLRRHEGLKVVYLELGVGNNTPGIIKYPFWQMTAATSKATYISINLGQAYAPPEIKNRSLCLNANIAEVIPLLRQL